MSGTAGQPPKRSAKNKKQQRKTKKEKPAASSASKPKKTQTESPIQRALKKVADTGTIASKSAALISFWDAASHKGIPIPLRTTFGNYSLHTFVDRFTFTASATHDTILWIPWSASPVSVMSFKVGTSGNPPVRQRTFSQMQSTTLGGSATSPVAIRPMRSSFRIANTSKQFSVDSQIFVTPYDSALPLHVEFGANASTELRILESMTARLRAFIQQDPNTRTYTGKELTKQHSFSSIPCSWVSYNNYHPFQPFYESLSNWDGSDSDYNTQWNMRSGDFYNLAVRGATEQFTIGNDSQKDESAAYPFVNTTQVMVNSGPLVDIPCMRGYLVLIPRNTPDAVSITADPETYSFERHLQLGCRFRPNTLGATGHHTPTPGTIGHEDTLLKSVMRISANPAQGLHSAVSDAHSMVSSVATGAAQAIEAVNSMKGLSDILASFG